MILSNGITPIAPVEGSEGDSVQTRFSFDPQLAQVFDPYFCKDSPLKPFEELRSFHFALDPGQREDCEFTLERIQRFYHEEEKQFYNRFLMAFYDLLMLVSNLSSTVTSIQRAPVEKERAVQKIIAYIESRYTEDIRLEHLEAELHMSKFYLSRIFREMTDMTIVDYLSHRRIKQAKLLFYYRKDSSVTEVCHEVGYNNLAHFSRVFKKHVGLSPDQYRKEH